MKLSLLKKTFVEKFQPRAEFLPGVGIPIGIVGTALSAGFGCQLFVGISIPVFFLESRGFLLFGPCTGYRHKAKPYLKLLITVNYLSAAEQVTSHFLYTSAGAAYHFYYIWRMGKK